MPRDHYLPGLGWMLELAMTSALVNLIPAIFVNKTKHISRLHAGKLCSQ